MSTTTRPSHLQWIDDLPEDVVPINEFKNHKFENLYYSPSTNEFYQAPKLKYRILSKDEKYLKCRTNKSSSSKISIKKLLDKLTNNSS